MSWGSPRVLMKLESEVVLFLTGEGRLRLTASARGSSRWDGRRMSRSSDGCEVGQDEVERLLDLDDDQRPPRGCPEAPAGGAAHQGARLEDVPVGGADEQAEDLVLRAAQEGFEGARLAYYHGPVEEVVQVLRGWLVPGQGPVVPGRDPVDDALDAAQFLDGPEIRQLAPLLVPWLGSGAHHARALCLLCYLDHSSLRRILRPEAQAAGEATQALAPRTGDGPQDPDTTSPDRSCTTALHHLGL